jgi:serine-type D-Ala-D-Ala carboxypeptidase/endopeptidase (penicillin-binding protein 4)
LPSCCTSSSPMPPCSAAATVAHFKTGTFSGVRTLAGYADTSKHGRVRFVIALTSNNGAMRFRLLKAIRSEL